MVYPPSPFLFYYNIYNIIMNLEIEKIKFAYTHREIAWANDNLKLAFLCIPKVASTAIRNQFNFKKSCKIDTLPKIIKYLH